MEITFRVEILILIAVVFFILSSHLLCSCSKMGMMEAMTVAKKMTKGKGIKESFTGANINNGQSAPYSLNKNYPVNTSSWFTPDLTYSPGKPLSKGVKDILNRKEQPIPLPEGELSMFANTPFKPECCPNTYSNSTGCACMTVGQYNYLIDRGGNNVPYSEY